MNKDILLMVKALSNEREVEEDTIFQAIEIALAAVAARRYSEDASIRVTIDRETGVYETFRCWTVMDDSVALELPEQQIHLCKARDIDPELKSGDQIEEPIENPAFGRIAAQQAKHVIFQKVREAERQKIIEQYQDRVGDLLIGIVKRVMRDGIVLDMGGSAEALLLREQMIPREAFRINDRLRGYLYELRDEKRGPQLLLTRTAPEFLIELFKIEVPEIGEEVIEIKSAARDPGLRAKIAVKTNDGRIDPIGACVGMRGSRVQAVSSELGGERIDIILWDDNPAQLVINAMAPAEVASIVVDEESRSMDIAVSEDQLSQAIGRNGQNVRLASELTKWSLNIMTEDQAVEKHENETSSVKELFIEKLGVDEGLAEVLANEGFSDIEELAYAASEEMRAIEGFDQQMVEALQKRASDYLLMQEIANQEEQGDLKPSEDLLSLKGISTALARELAKQGIKTRNDLAEQSVAELQDIIVDIDDKKAAELIMQAREHWFKRTEE